MNTILAFMPGGVVYDPPPPEVGSMRLEPVMSGRDPEC